MPRLQPQPHASQVRPLDEWKGEDATAGLGAGGGAGSTKEAAKEAAREAAREVR